ncbi:MAG: Gmad2 immunoglobulin-like domain-containing protein [Chloroflexi bacterium]|nr:Gmad2 immunoglobulin-like domain-containing protein [Chloroflexota bacterium]
MRGKGFCALAIAIVLILGTMGCVRRGTATATISPSPTPRSSPTAKATPTPKPTATPTLLPSPAPQLANIIVSLPVSGQQVRSPLQVTGTARVFEAQVVIRIKNAAGAILARKSALASAGAPQWGIFTTELAFTPPSTQQGATVEIFSVSPRDGKEENLVTIPVILLPQ